MMALLNDIADTGSVNKAEYKALLIMLNPFAPHMTEEIWELQNFGGMLNETKWVTYDPDKCVEATVEIAVQLAGKIKARIQVPADAGKDEILAQAKADPAIAALIAGKTIIKEIVVPGKLVNLVVK